VKRSVVVVVVVVVIIVTVSNSMIRAGEFVLIAVCSWIERSVGSLGRYNDKISKFHRVRLLAIEVVHLAWGGDECARLGHLLGELAGVGLFYQFEVTEVRIAAAGTSASETCRGSGGGQVFRVDGSDIHAERRGCSDK
jgi:hypothetical protein